jgi:hypothetical protein
MIGIRIAEQQAEHRVPPGEVESDATAAGTERDDRSVMAGHDGKQCGRVEDVTWTTVSRGRRRVIVELERVNAVISCPCSSP